MPALNFRQRLGLVHFGVILVVLSLAAGAAYWSLSRAVHGQLDAALLALAETEAGMVAEEHGAVVWVHEAVAGTAPLSFVRLDRLIQIVDAKGMVLAQSANLGTARLPVHPDTLARVERGDTVFETLRDFGEEPTRLVTVPLGAGSTMRLVQVAGSLDDSYTVLRAAAVLFAVLAAVLWLSVGAAGAFMTGRVFNAIDDIVTKAHRIGDADLSQRLPHPGTPDEIGRLVDTLNEMLARIESNVDVQRRFTADASHELRSPLSRLRTELELSLRRPREPEVYVETLRSGLEEVERMTLLVEELLTLARLDAGQDSALAGPTLLNRLVEDSIRRMSPIAEAQKVALTMQATQPVHAIVAASLCSLLIDNLLDNAIKFSPAGGLVGVTLVADGDRARLVVRDQGPGIAAADLPRVFERFYRGSIARSSGKPGMGVGLALAQAIAHASAGEITVSDTPGAGAEFVVTLPSAPG